MMQQQNNTSMGRRRRRRQSALSSTTAHATVKLMMMFLLLLAILMFSSMNSSSSTTRIPCGGEAFQPSRVILLLNPKTRISQQQSATLLRMVQKKKPRFTQQKHLVSKEEEEDEKQQPLKNGERPIRQATPIKRRNFSSKQQQQQPWDSGKSIEELEASMSKQWGTLDPKSSQQIPKGYRVVEDDFDDDYDDKDPPSKSVSKWRRPVLDPWEAKQQRKTTNKNGTSKSNAPRRIVREEFYDEDDEGFEYDYDDVFGDDDDDDGDVSPKSILNVKHLIAPKPAGGRGTSSTGGGGGGYFFNPNAASTVESSQNNAPKKKDRKSKSTQFDTKPSVTDRAADENTSEPPRKEKSTRPRPPPAKPLLDQDGNPRLLTVDEALRQFQQTVDEGTMEIIETAQVPIVAYSRSQSWSDVGVTSSVLLENLDYMNCPTPLAVQEKTTPAILTGSDLLVGTYTGSGKTLAFLVPLIQRLLWSIENVNNNNSNSDIGLAVLIVAPGRELASQIVSVARELLQDTGLTVQLAIGGTTFSRCLEQIRKKKPNIVVGTPGRIAELVVGKPGETSGRLKVGSLQTLVLDEFDALLEYKPHRDPTRAIMESLKRRHGESLQSVLCSATATDVMNSAKVKDFIRPGYETAMADDNDVLVTEAGTSSSSSNNNNDEDPSKSAGAPQVSRTVLHGVVHLDHRRFALEAVRRILHTEPVPQQILIFVENARKVDIVVEKLADRGIIAAPLHGGSGSEKMDRAEVSRALREGYVGIVVATEMAARGLDAPLLTHVINMDLPTDASHYAHRAGRCGRGGRPGVVINITTNPKERNVPKRFTNQLGVDLYSVEPRNGKLMMIDPDTQVLDS